LKSLTEVPMYIASFSECKDVLSQWRGYCKGGDGYDVGFMPQTLTGLKNAGFRLLRCVYALDQQKTLCNALIDAYLDIDSKFVGKRSLVRGISKSDWRTKFSLLAAAIKHESFAEEFEWRLVGSEDKESDLHFRAGRFGVVPYLQIPLATADEKVPVAELVVGPTDDRKATLEGATKIMKRFARERLDHRIIARRPPGMPPVIAAPNDVDYLITSSTTPYRD
ncbi:MAG: DUF2971 domain-containing protein, partial [Terracidiphilus sp.]